MNPNNNNDEKRIPSNENKELVDRSNNKQKRPDKRSKDYRRGRRQDPFWYAKDKAAIERIAKFPFLNVVGSPLTAESADVVPAMVTILTNHCVGSTENIETDDSINRAADAFFQYATQGYSGGVSDFESPDLMMLSIAAADTAAFIAECQRVINPLHLYTEENKYYAKHIVAGMGFDYDSFFEEETSLADYVSDLNIRIDQFNKTVVLPRNFFLAERWIYLASFSFMDNNQMYYSTPFSYVMAHYLKFDVTSSITGTCLKSQVIRTPSTVMLTARRAIQILDDMLKALTGDDARQMFAALRRVYQNSDMLQCQQATMEGYNPFYRNDIVSTSLHNADFVDMIRWYNGSGDLSNSGFAVYQSGGKIKTDPFVRPIYNKQALIAPRKEHLIDTFGVDVSAAEMLDITASLLAYTGPLVLGGAPEGTNYLYQRVVPRTEINYHPILVINDSATDKPVFKQVNMFKFANDTGPFGPTYADMALVSHINSHPYFEVLTVASDRGGLNVPSSAGNIVYDKQYYIGEVDRYTTVSDMTLSKLHSKTMYNLLSMPVNTKSITK